MNKLLALGLLLALPALVAADVEGMVWIGPDFYIDRYEYPNQRGTLPKVDVTWGEAESLCTAQGKRLCTEQECRKPCTGPQNFAYSYGPEFEPRRCNTRFAVNGVWQRGPGLEPSGAHERCTNAYGVYDMIGNAWEWTASWYSHSDRWRVVRGGSFFHSVNLARADARYGRFLDSEYHLDLVGFRCCRAAAPSQAP